MKNYKAIIFDRDGTLNVSSTGLGGYVLDVNSMKLLPKVKSVLAALSNKGVSFYVFTQQSCIGKGLLAEKELYEINNRLNSLLDENARIKKFYHCPHVKVDGCECIKPSPKMLLDCLNENNLNAEEVLVVGDSLRDHEAAKNAGLDYVFVPNDLGKVTVEEYKDTGAPLYNNLEEIVQAYFK